MSVSVILTTIHHRQQVAASETDSMVDAFVDGHTIAISARVAGQVERVLVDEYQRVKQGDLLIELDKEPYKSDVATKQADVVAAEADLAVAQAQARALVAQVRANRFKLAQAIEDVNAQIASLRASVAALDSKKATLELAQTNLSRGEELAEGVVSKEEISKRRQAVQVAEAAIEEAVHEVEATRASLGLPRRTAQSSDLGIVPADHDQTDSSVRQSLLELLQSLALLGYAPSSWRLTPQQLIDEFNSQDPNGDIDRIYANLLNQAPVTKQSEAKLIRARHDLEHAEFALRYCDIRSPSDGVVIAREANCGEYVQVGHNLMQLSPLKDIWISAMVPMTKSKGLKPKQPVRCQVTTQVGQREIDGRVSSWRRRTISQAPTGGQIHQPDTGSRGLSSIAVRIDLSDYEPGDNPLFVDLPAVVFLTQSVNSVAPGSGR